MDGCEISCAGEREGPEGAATPKHNTCWISTSFLDFPRMGSLGCTLRIKDPLIKGNLLFSITFTSACNYCEYWLGIREFPFLPVQC